MCPSREICRCIKNLQESFSAPDSACQKSLRAHAFRFALTSKLRFEEIRVPHVSRLRHGEPGLNSSFCEWLPTSLAPVSSVVAIAAAPAIIVAGNPDGSGTWGTTPMTTRPDIALSIPPVISTLPYVSRTWRRTVVLDNMRRRPDADRDLRLSGDRQERRKQNQDCNFFQHDIPFFVGVALCGAHLQARRQQRCCVFARTASPDFPASGSADA